MALKWDGRQSSRGSLKVSLQHKDDRPCQDIFSISVTTTWNILSLLPRLNLVLFWIYQVVEYFLLHRPILYCYYCFIIMAAGHSVLSLLFTGIPFSLPNLRGRLADRQQTLPHVWWWPRFIKFGQKFGWPLPPEIWRTKNIKFRRHFAQLRDSIANIAGMRQDIVNRKTSCKLRTLPHRQT